MVDVGGIASQLRFDSSGSLNPLEFPPLLVVAAVVVGRKVETYGIASEAVVNPSIEASDDIVAPGASSGKDWKFLFSGKFLSFFPPANQNGRVVVQPPKEVINLGAKQLEKALLGFRFRWGRE
ncbi:hypothetical protein V6N11_049245 [Hibiscus sabdariffa]|uniref:Uncharacterized protein n=1 Tax=Hibiscus sabdariffa TaxID=183260 RepID=A0ABR2P0B4_9ROSI